MSKSICLEKEDCIIVKAFSSYFIVKTDKNDTYVIDDFIPSECNIKKEITLKENESIIITANNPVSIIVKCINKKIIYEETFDSNFIKN